MNNTKDFSFIDKTLAWSVHTFTASGLLAGFMAILAINAQDWRQAMLWLLACLVIDAVDGTFARMFRVKEVLPYMDGKTIDYVIDFATYAIIPAYFFHEAGLVEEAWRLPCTAVILLVSALYYGKEGMVSEDMYFIGFPVMWNIVIFYMVFVFHLPGWLNAFFILFFAALHFIPIKFVYPSQATRFKALTIFFTVVLVVCLAVITWFYPVEYRVLKYAAIASASFYGLMAIYNTWLE